MKVAVIFEDTDGHQAAELSAHDAIGVLTATPAVYVSEVVYCEMASSSLSGPGMAKLQRGLALSKIRYLIRSWREEFPAQVSCASRAYRVLRNWKRYAMKPPD